MLILKLKLYIMQASIQHSHPSVKTTCTVKRKLAILLFPSVIFLITAVALLFWEIGKQVQCVGGRGGGSDGQLATNVQ